MVVVDVSIVQGQKDEEKGIVAGDPIGLKVDDNGVVTMTSTGAANVLGKRATPDNTDRDTADEYNEISIEGTWLKDLSRLSCNARYSRQSKFYPSTSIVIQVITTTLEKSP